MRVSVACSDIQNCNLDCLHPFTFPGARNVTTVNIQNNKFSTLPEALLWSMTNLINFYARDLRELRTLPEKLFKGWYPL